MTDIMSLHYHVSELYSSQFEGVMYGTKMRDFDGKVKTMDSHPR